MTPPDGAGGDSEEMFQDSLAPYGNWVDVAGYGRCWQPTVVVANPGWQPYFNCGGWGFFRLRLVLALGLFVGLGSISLRELVPPCQPWVVLGSGSYVGAILGFLAIR